MSVNLVYDPFDASMHVGEYPAELYGWMRNECPLYRNEDHDFWALSRFSDIQAVARDWQTYSSGGPRGVDLDGTGSDVYGDGNFIEIDPPRHDVLRDVVRRAFSPKEIAELTAVAKEEALSLLAPMRDSRGGDLATGLCWPLAFNVMMRMLGVPQADRPHVEHLLLSANMRASSTEELPPSVLAAGEELRAYAARLVFDGDHLQDGLLAHIAAAHASGLLNEAEVSGMSVLLMFAGIEAPAMFAASALVLLAQHPAERERLRLGEVACEPAVDEMIRYESTVQALARTTTAPVRLHGIELPESATVVLVYGAANRDERRWDMADTLDFGRPHQRSLAFGEGLHFCLGAALARLEARVAIEALLACAPRYELSEPVTRTVKWCDWGVLRAPVAW